LPNQTTNPVIALSNTVFQLLYDHCKRHKKRDLVSHFE